MAHWRLLALGMSALALRCAPFGAEQVTEPLQEGTPEGGVDPTVTLAASIDGGVRDSAAATTDARTLSGNVGTCLDVQASCGSATRCCEPYICDHIGGLIATNCCGAATASCTEDNDCCGQLHCNGGRCE